MIRVLIGDLFLSQAQTLVNTVNCVGVMGKGVALEFRKRFPDMYEDYLARCRAGQVRLGQPHLFRRLIRPWILNFPTKEHWRSVAQIQDIVRGLQYLKDHYKEWGLTSLGVPPLGCGQGQLEWRVVGPTLYRHLSELDIPVELYAPYGTPSEEIQSSFLSQPTDFAVIGPGQGRITPGWVALVNIVALIEKEPYHWPIGRVIFQKIAYFATETGLPTGLTYSRSSFGPYTPDIKRRITQLVNNGLIREEPRGQMLRVTVGPTFEDARKTYQVDIEKLEPIARRIADLFLRMNTKQAEVAATVHFAAKSLATALKARPSEKEVLSYVLEWKQRRRPPLDQAEIASTIRNLAALGWIEVKASKELPLTDEVAVET